MIGTRISKGTREDAGVTRILATVLAASLALAVPATALHPNHPLGFDPERSTQSFAEGLDFIDLFSGSLALTLPIGPFKLNYSSNVWRYQVTAGKGGLNIVAVPDRTVNAGLGWHLGWGEVYHPTHGLNDTGAWLYVGHDGGRHTFYSELHRDDDSDLDDPQVFYTRDGSYLRLRVPNNYHVDIEFPDGTTRRYDSGTGGQQSTYFLHKVWSPFASESDPDLLVEYDRESPGGAIIGLERTVTDRHGRVHYVHLTGQYSWIDQVVTQVDIQGFEGQRMTYDFFYDEILVNRSCKDNVSSDRRISVPHLKQIDLPDGTSFKMKEGTELLYYNQCKNENKETIDDVAGVLRGLDLPSGGKLRWSFQEYEFPPGDTSSVFNTSAGVEYRRLLGADDTEHGSWRYRTSAHDLGGAEREVHTEVSVLPEGDCTKHFFDARYSISPSQMRGWEYGLPFAYSEEEAGRYLSRRVFPTTAANGSCTGTPIRSTYMRFRRDTPPGTNDNPDEWRALNRQVEAMRVVYHDDDDRWSDTEVSEFDGLGHFRRSVGTGTFRDSPTSERRETFIDYNRTSGVYPGSYVQLPDDAPWVLGVFGETVVTEDDAVGESVARSEYGFDSATGFPSCVRTLASGTARGTNDLLTTFERDSSDVEGLVSDAKRYGGDNQPLSTGGADCGTVPSQPDYWNHHDYQFGVLVKTTPRTPAGVDGSFPTYDVDLDPATGWELRQRDTAGYETTLDYDGAGRLVSVTPQDGAWIEFTYTNATPPTAPARVTTIYRAVGGSTVLTQSETVLDDFGRRQLERRLLADKSFSERETLYNARGWTTSVSQWGDLTKTTQYLDFDPFGRPSTIRPPDGSGHDVRFNYLGDREVTKEVKIALAGGEAYVPRTWEADRYGRLRVVRELSGPASPGPQETPTTYDFDVGGRLTRSVSGVGLLQTRSFAYDNRGFLLSETHPEKGAAGNGTVFYDYDSAGLPHRKLDGPHDLAYEYDFIGRLLRIRDRNQGNRLLTYLQWDAAAGFGEGKLEYATRHNHIDLPWSTQGEETVEVQQAFIYSGVGGAVSRKTTKVLWSLDDVTFHQDFGYDDLSNLTDLTYPRCTTVTACISSDAGALRTVNHVYTNGWLTNVTGWTTQIDYHPSGVWKSVHHANGVVDHFTPDGDFTSRPLQIRTTGVVPATKNFDSGQMTYDGAGFLTATGDDVFTYDPAGRLATASISESSYQQSYDYDRFGNVTAIHPIEPGTTPPTVDSATNRLVGDSTVYDSAGNLERWNDFYLSQWRYDEFDQVVLQNWMRYVYDAFGERAISIANSGPGYENAVFHLRDLGHRRTSAIRMADGNWSLEQDYIYALGRVLASNGSGNSAVDHYHQDHLGSTRLITDAGGNVRYRYLYLPYGEEVYESQGDSIMFTGHERDFSTDADYMHARHYHHELGRFLSVDPLRGEPSRPQSLNRYAYALGNPINFTDPTGLDTDDGDHDGPDINNKSIPPEPKESGFDLFGLLRKIYNYYQRFRRDERAALGGPGKVLDEEYPKERQFDGSPNPDPAPDDDSDDEIPDNSGDCPRILSFAEVSSMIREEEAVKAFKNSAHGRLLEGTKLATIPTPPVPSLLSGALQVAELVVAHIQADSRVRFRARERLYGPLNPRISSVDPKCRR